MCATHWRLVPKAVQDRVYKHYRAQNWGEWGSALDDARVAVATALGAPVPARLLKPKAVEIEPTTAICLHPAKQHCNFCGENFCPADGCDPNHREACREASRP